MIGTVNEWLTIGADPHVHCSWIQRTVPKLLNLSLPRLVPRLTEHLCQTQAWPGLE